MMGGQNVELSVARLNVCTVLHVKPEKIWGGKRLQRGGECPPAPPPLNATLLKHNVVDIVIEIPRKPHYCMAQHFQDVNNFHR